jgi:peroxiredoxin/predicted 2-oxoglutarate/Fe(II)-dependent dioxygenase YbiX
MPARATAFGFKAIMTISPLSVGDPAPWFAAASGPNDSGRVSFDELAGRHIVLFFFDAATRPDVAEALAALSHRRDLFDGARALLVGISCDSRDVAAGSPSRGEGQLLLCDVRREAATQYGIAEPDAGGRPAVVRPTVFVLGPALQIIDVVPLTAPAALVDRVVSLMSALPAEPAGPGAPVLGVPQVFDRPFCARLIELYEAAGGREIGVIETGGRIVEHFDPTFRKRLDWHIADQQAVERCKLLLARRLLPMVYRAFQFNTTRIERYLIGCYDSVTGGYFKPHRDNTAPVVAHRRFAVTINLNEDYDGGFLRFPEFGPQTYRSAPGDAIVFSCSLLHEVMPITRARRYAFLTFFYDEASQRMRDEYQRRMSGAKNPAMA